MARRGLSLRPVDSEKHEVTYSNLASNASTAVVVDLIVATDPSTTNSANEVTVGSTVKWIFMELNWAAETVTSPKVIHWYIVKKPFGVALGAGPSTYNDNFKRFILKRGMEMLPKDVGTVTKRIFTVKIPPRLRRFGDADELSLIYICSSSETINACGFGIYRAYK